MENMLKEPLISVPNKAKCRVVWEDNPENYTQERVKRIAD